jgi:hypothetical protein
MDVTLIHVFVVECLGDDTLVYVLVMECLDDDADLCFRNGMFA